MTSPSITTQQLPDYVEQGAQGGMSFLTNVVTSSSGSEQRTQNWLQQRLKWTIGYGIFAQSDYTPIVEFFAARQGRTYGFLFHDWSDDTATNEPVVNPLLSPGNVADGLQGVFHLARTYEKSGFPFTRLILYPDTASIVVFVNGIPNNTYTLGSKGTIVWTGGNIPTVGQVITWSGTYKVPVRFDVDNFTLTLAALAAGTITQLRLIELRVDPNTNPVGVSISTGGGGTNTVAELPSPLNLLDSQETASYTTSTTLIGTVTVLDDGYGINVVTLSGADAASFTYNATTKQLFLNAGVSLDFEAKTSFALTINAYDSIAGSSTAVSTNFTLTVTDVVEVPAVTLSNIVSEIATVNPSVDTKVCDITALADSGHGTLAVTLTGAQAADFSVVGSFSGTGGQGPYSNLTSFSGISIHLNAGINLSIAQILNYTININDPNAIGSHPSVVIPSALIVGVVPGSTTYTTVGTTTFTVPVYNTLTIEVIEAANGTWGYSPSGGTAPATPGQTYIQNDQTRPANQRWRVQPFQGAPPGAPSTPSYQAATAIMNSYGIGTALDVSTAGQIGGAGAVVTDNVTTSSGHITGTITNPIPLPPNGLSISGKGGDQQSGPTAAGGASQSQAIPSATPGTSVANGQNGANPGAGAGGGIYVVVAGLTGNAFIGLQYTFIGTAMAGAQASAYAKKIWHITDPQSGSPPPNTYNAGAPQPGDILTVVIGAGGVGGAGTCNGGNGGNGWAKITVA